MEDFSHQLGGAGGGGGGGGGGGTSSGSLLYLPLVTETSTVTATARASTESTAPLTPRAPSAEYGRSYLLPGAATVSTTLPYLGSPRFKAEADPSRWRTVEDHGEPPGDEATMKAKIVSHPQYSTLLATFMDCQKVGAPPDVAERLSAVARQAESHSRCGHKDSSDPEIDQFMEAYCSMLVKYREELTRPLQEAADFLKRIESQFNSLAKVSSASSRLFSSDEKCEGVGSSDEEQGASGGEADQLPEIDPRAEDKELKHHLLKRYSGYLSSLRQELSKKKKKGKLPKEARQKLLNWWELHHKWPYPSETEKVALAESTGLDQKQINNWFINQRKRHWKPSEDMQFVVMDGFHPHNSAATAALFMDGQFMGDALYRIGP